MTRDSIIRARIRNVGRLRLYGPAVLIGVCLVAYNLLADEACIEEEIENEGQEDPHDQDAQKEQQRKDALRLRGNFIAYAGFDSQMASDLRKSGNPQHTANHKSCERTCYFRYDCTGFVLRTANSVDAVRYRYAKTCYFQTAEPLKLVMGKGAARNSTLFVYQNSSHKLELLLASMGLSEHFDKLEAFRAAHNNSRSIERISSSAELARAAGGMAKPDAEGLWVQLHQGRKVSREASRGGPTGGGMGHGNLEEKKEKEEAYTAMHMISRLRNFVHGQDSFNLTRAEQSSSTISTSTASESATRPLFTRPLPTTPLPTPPLPSPPLCFIGTCCGWGHKLRRVAASFVEIHYKMGRVAAVDLGSCSSGAGLEELQQGSFGALFFDSWALRGARRADRVNGFMQRVSQRESFDAGCERANTISVGWDQGLRARAGARAAAVGAARSEGAEEYVGAARSEGAARRAMRGAASPTRDDTSAFSTTEADIALPDLREFIAPAEALLRAKGHELDVQVRIRGVHRPPCR
jgi:hypothetical protein